MELEDQIIIVKYIIVGKVYFTFRNSSNNSTIFVLSKLHAEFYLRFLTSAFKHAMHAKQSMAPTGNVAAKLLVKEILEAKEILPPSLFLPSNKCYGNSVRI